jgi:branched-chain amino acid transport system substrate-binding protein
MQGALRSTKSPVVLIILLVGALAGVTAAYGRPAAGPSTATAPQAGAVRCGTQVTIGIAAPITGPVASLGGQQLSWAKFYVSRWNRFHKLKVRLVQGDTMLNPAEATKVAQQFGSNSRMLAVVGPAGSQEVVASTSAYKSKGLAFVSGSATRTTLTTDGTRKGYFFRVVPNDSVQGPTVANYIFDTLKARRVFIIDDQETYSTGLADTVQRILDAKQGVTVQRDSISQQATDFSSVVAKIGNNVQVVYVPWQIASQAQTFGTQLRSQGKRATLFGSDGLFDPSTFKIEGSYISFFPINGKDALFTAYTSSHGGNPNFFGSPTFVATQVVVRAVAKACANGTATRAEVRRNVAATKLKTSLLGFGISFDAKGDITPAKFGIYKVVRGAYTPVG